MRRLVHSFSCIERSYEWPTHFFTKIVKFTPGMEPDTKSDLFEGESDLSYQLQLSKIAYSKLGLALEQ